MLTPFFVSLQYCSLEQFQNVNGKTRSLNTKNRQHNGKQKEQQITCRVTLVTSLVISYIVLYSLFLTFSLVILWASHLIEWILSVSTSQCILSLPNLDFTTSIFRGCIAQGIFIRSSWLYLWEFWEFNMYFPPWLVAYHYVVFIKTFFFVYQMVAAVILVLTVSFQNVISMIYAKVKYHSGSFSFLSIHNCFDRLLQKYLI